MADRQVRSRIGRGAVPILACVVTASMLCACAGGNKPRTTGGGGLVPALSARPRVPSSAAERFSGPNASPLDFYDELERRDLVSHDDALHAVLLLSLGRSEQTFVQRVAMAKERGIVDMKFDRPPREAVTIGELARMLDRSMQGNNVVPKTEAQALRDLQSDGVIPAASRAPQGLTGAQMLAVLGAASEVMTTGQGVRPRTIASVRTDGTEPRPPAAEDLTPGAPPAIAAKPEPTEPPTPEPVRLEPGRPEPARSEPARPEATPVVAIPEPPKPAPIAGAPAARPEPPPPVNAPAPAAPPPAPAPAESPKPLPPPPPLDSKPTESPKPAPAPSPSSEPPKPETPKPPPPKTENPPPKPVAPTPEPLPPPPAPAVTPPPPPAPSPWVSGKPLRKNKKTTPSGSGS